MTDREKMFWVIGKSKGNPQEFESVARFIELDLGEDNTLATECLYEAGDMLNVASAKILTQSVSSSTEANG